MSSRFVVGIDLGTSNSALAWCAPDPDPAADPAPVSMMPVEQVVAPGAVEARPTLPSVIYVRGQSELPEGALNLPWTADPGYCVGAFAREQGARIPTRMIHSAKSWLCHTGIDREGRFLPHQSQEEDAKRSPVECATLVLEHLRRSWNRVHPDADLAAQDIVLCVPASFDAGARQLTVAAAERAGLPNVSLLEEPQAAFYAWVDSCGEDWRRRVRIGDLVLVIDVGGGTTDFSLIAVAEEGGELALRRIAVGEHILLGGDNMDLALAYSAAARIEQEKTRKPDAQQMASLVQQCRAGKEALLAPGAPAEWPISLLGRGSSVIGGTIRTELRRDALEQIVLEGFFPICTPSDRPARPTRSGFREAGLPYASDPAISLHLARFLGQHRDAAAEAIPGRAGGEVALPTAVLFNGGVFKAAPLRDRVMALLGEWCRTAGIEEPRALEGNDLDLAVARGAAAYARAKRGRGVRIRGGSARTYYIGIESAAPAVPGIKPPLRAMCVVPFGMEEGETRDISGRDVDLCIWTGEPAEFRFLSSTSRRHDEPGTIHVVDDDAFEEHHPIETTLESGAAGSRAVEVDLRSHLTPIGTLELACVERGTNVAWKLEFNVRQVEGAR